MDMDLARLLEPARLIASLVKDKPLTDALALLDKIGAEVATPPRAQADLALPALSDLAKFLDAESQARSVSDHRIIVARALEPAAARKAINAAINAAPAAVDAMAARFNEALAVLRTDTEGLPDSVDQIRDGAQFDRMVSATAAALVLREVHEQREVIAGLEHRPSGPYRSPVLVAAPVRDLDTPREVLAPLARLSVPTSDTPFVQYRRAVAAEQAGRITVSLAPFGQAEPRCEAIEQVAQDVWLAAHRAPGARAVRVMG